MPDTSLGIECSIAWLPPSGARPESALPPASDRWPIPPAAPAGLARLFSGWLARCAVGDIAGLSLALWLGDEEWIGEVGGVGGATIRETGIDSEANHLLFRLLDAAARALGAEMPAPLVHAFDDLATRSPAALLTYFAAEGTAGAARRQALVRAFELDAAFLAPRLALAEERLAGGDAAAAAALLRGADVHDPERARELGLACWEAGEAETALALLGSAVGGNANDGLAHAALAALLASRGDTEESFLLASRATGLIPDDYRAWSALAEVLRARGDHGQAAFYYHAALRLAPQAPHLLKAAAAAQIAAGRPDQALPLIERALAAAPADAENHANFAIVRQALGDLAAARAAAEEARRLAPADPRFAALCAELDAARLPLRG